MRVLLRRTPIFLFLFLTLIGLTRAGETGGSIEVTVVGAKSGVGQVVISLFDSQESFLVSPLTEHKIEVDRRGNAQISLGRHVPGEYAIAVVYDQNMNGKLDTGLFGIPKEKTGFSNNPRTRFGPPKWNDVRFTLADEVASVDIRLFKAGR